MKSLFLTLFFIISQNAFSIDCEPIEKLYEQPCHLFTDKNGKYYLDIQGCYFEIKWIGHADGCPCNYK